MVLDITKNKRVDTVLLERITNEVEKRHSTNNYVPPVTTDNKPNTDQFCIVDSGSEHQEQVSGRSRETEQLMSSLGNVLQQVHNSIKIIFCRFLLLSEVVNEHFPLHHNALVVCCKCHRRCNSIIFAC
jgi:hypothetical protein